MTDLPPDPRVARQHAVALYLRAGIVVAFGLGALGLVAPGPTGRAFSVAMVVTLVLVPLGRVAWLLVRWLRRGDRRFAAAAAVLLTIIAAGAALTW